MRSAPQTKFARRNAYFPRLEQLEQRNGPTSLAGVMAPPPDGPGGSPDPFASDVAALDGPSPGTTDTTWHLVRCEESDTSAPPPWFAATSAAPRAEDTAVSGHEEPVVQAAAETAAVMTAAQLGTIDPLARDGFEDPLSLPDAFAANRPERAGGSGDVGGAFEAGTAVRDAGGSSPAVLAAPTAVATTGPAVAAAPAPDARALGDLTALASQVQTAAPAPSGDRAPAAPSTVPATSHAPAALLASPAVAFEANEGQADPQVSFLARGAGETVSLTPTEAVQRVQQPDGSGFALSMQLVGARTDTQAVGLDQLPGRVNYLQGNDPNNWHIDIPRFAAVAYPGVYPGVDLVYHGTAAGQLEYDFQVAPGTDPGAIRLQFPGAEAVRLDGQGNLVVHTAAGDAVQQAPVLYQQAGAARQAVDGRFVVQGNQVGFAVGAYDASRPLVIDPVWNWYFSNPANTPTLDPRFTYYVNGGVSGTQQGNAVAVDASGNTYVTGVVSSATSGSLGGTGGQSNSDAFVWKLDAQGVPVWLTYLGGSGSDEGRGIAVDSLGQAYVTGGTTSTNFPVMPGALQTQLAPGTYENAFLTKLSAGGGILYSTYFGLGRSGSVTLNNTYNYTYAETSEVGNGVAVDQYGTADFVGETSGIENVTIPFGQPTPPPDYPHIFDAFVVKLPIADPFLPPPPNYTPFIDFFGGAGTFNDPNYLAGHDAAKGVAVDPQGNFYVTGTTSSVDFPVTAGAYQTVLGGNSDAFARKYQGWPVSGVVYSTFLGGNDNDNGYGIAVDGAGNAYVTGDTISTVGFVGDVPDGWGNPTLDAYAVELIPTGSALAYGIDLGGANVDHGYGIAVNAAGDAFVTGTTQFYGPWTPSYPQVNAFAAPGPALYAPSHDTGNRAFVSEVAPGGGLAFSSILGVGETGGYGIAVEPQGPFHMTGYDTGVWESGDMQYQKDVQYPFDVLVAVATP
jgi:hypothetical protein